MRASEIQEWHRADCKLACHVNAQNSPYAGSQDSGCHGGKRCSNSREELSRRPRTDEVAAQKCDRRPYPKEERHGENAKHPRARMHDKRIAQDKGRNAVPRGEQDRKRTGKRLCD